MRLLLYALLILITCQIAPRAFGWMDPSVAAQSTVYNVGDSLQNEQCWIPPHLSQAIYDANDSKTEYELCQFNFYSHENNAICPKTKHTNPGIDFYVLPPELSKNDFIENYCLANNIKQSKADKIAKYKVSSSCSYSPAPLMAYHLSRLLGNILQVPVAVLRTVSKQTYLEMATQAKSILKNSTDTIAKTWPVLELQLSTGSQARSPFILTANQQTTVGAMVSSIGNEKDWDELMTGENESQAVRAQLFMQLPSYQTLTNPEEISQTISTSWSADNVQALATLGDVSDMLLFDYLMAQNDRFFNIAYSNAWAVLKKGFFTSKLQITSTAIAGPNPPANNAVQIRRMVLKDNDCGLGMDRAVIHANIVDQAGMLNNLRHVKASTYYKIINLAQLIKSNARFTSQFHNLCINELMMTEKDYQALINRILSLSQKLSNDCQQSQLKLDLDLDNHFLKKVKPLSCQPN